MKIEEKNTKNPILLLLFQIHFSSTITRCNLISKYFKSNNLQEKNICFSLSVI